MLETKAGDTTNPLFSPIRYTHLLFYVWQTKRYKNTSFIIQADRMPEPIRLKMSGVTPQQAAVYEEFA